jgi:VCBS repeat-containing protein
MGFDLAAQIAPTPTADGVAVGVTIAEGEGPVQLPAGDAVLDAAFARNGGDLQITTPDGAQFLVVDFFRAEAGPDLVLADGKLLPHDLVTTLAGPLAPGQYAQAAVQAGQGGGLVEIGRVEKIAGKVTATHANGGKEALEAGSPVFQKDVLETSGSGSVAVKFADGTNFSLGSDARMVLDELIYNPAAKSGSAVMSVLKGTFVFITGEVAASGADAMKVRTPSGTLGIRGTTVGCAVEQGGAVTCMLLPSEDGSTDHEVAFENQLETVILTEPFEAVNARGARSPLATGTATAQQAQSLLGNSVFGGAFDYLKSTFETRAGPEGNEGGVHEYGDPRFGLSIGSIFTTLGGLNDDPAPPFVPPSASQPKDILTPVPPPVLSVSEGNGGATSGDLRVLKAGEYAPFTPPITFAASQPGLAGVTLGGQSVQFIISGDGKTLTAYVGSVDNVVFVATVSDNSTYSFVLLQNLDHPPGGGMNSLGLAFNFVAAEGADSFSVIVIDDVPVANSDVAAAVNESALPGGSGGGATVVSGNLLANDDAGADGDDIISVNGVTPDGNGVITVVTSAGMLKVYTVAFDSHVAGDYVYVLQHGTSATQNVFTYTLRDFDGDTSSTTLTVPIVDGAPIVAADSYSTAEDTPKIVAAASGVLANDSDVDGVLTASLVSGPSHGTLTLNADGSFTYTPNANFDGQDSFVYRANSVDGDFADATVTINVGAVNDAPVIGAAVLAGSATEIADGAAGENTATHTASGTLAFTDVDLTDAHTVSAVPQGGGYRGSFSAVVTNSSTGDGSGTVTWTFTIADSAIDDLAAGQTLIQTYLVTIDDGHGGSDAETITVTITGTNDAPVVAGTDVTGGVTELVAPTGNLTDSGTIAFSDVDLTDVHSVGAVTASAGALGTLTASVTTDTTGSGAGGVISWSYSVAAAAVEYLAAGQTKIETFTFTLNDGHGGLVERTVTVTITGTNDAPVIGAAVLAGSATEIADGAAGENTATHTASGTLAFTDVDLTDGHTVGAVPQGGGYRGSFSAVVTNSSTGDGAGVVTWTFTIADSAIDDLAAGQTLTQTYLVTIDDGHGGSDSETVTVTITGTNDAPVLTIDTSGAVTEDVAVNAGGNLTDSGTLSFVDVDATDTVTVSAAYNDDAVWSAGVLTLAQIAAISSGFSVDGNSWDYTVSNAALDFLGVGETITLSFDVTVTDSSGTSNDSDTETVTITIFGTNDAPVVNPESYTLDEDTTLTVSAASGVLANDSDVDGDTLTADLVTGPSHGTLVLNPDGSFSYTPDADYFGADSFTYRVFDGTTYSAPATVNLTINDVADALVAGAFLKTNTNQTTQTLRVFITEDFGANVVASEETQRAGTGQESTLQFEEPVLFAPQHDYLVAIKFVGGDGQTNVTDFDLIKDVFAPDPDAPSNVFQTLLDTGNIQLGQQGNGHDGVIWQITGAGNNFTVSVPIVYDISSAGGIDTVTLDSEGSQESFALDFRLVPTTGNDGADALFGDIETLDFSGGSQEANTLTLDADAVIDVTDANDTLTILGGANDTLKLVDQDGANAGTWQQGATAGGFTTWTYVDTGAVLATLQVDSDILVQANTAA